MRPPGRPDTFSVVNGPEDGTEFPVVRSPFCVGRDPACAVNVRLDGTIHPIHARLTVVSEGYRVRTLNGPPVLVNGRRAGLVRSRVLRSGDYIQVGQTLLALECAPDGLAGRSRGLVTDNDAVWLIRQTLHLFGSALHACARAVPKLLRELLTNWVALAALLVLLFLLWPAFNFLVRGLMAPVFNFLVELYRSLADWPSSLV